MCLNNLGGLSIEFFFYLFSIMKEYKVEVITWRGELGPRGNAANIENAINSWAKKGFELKNVRSRLSGETQSEEWGDGGSSAGYSFTEAYVLFFEKETGKTQP